MKRHNGAEPLIQLIAVNLFGGTVLGALFASVLLVLDLAGLRTLVLSSDNVLSTLIMVFAWSASTFATAAIAGAIMLLAAGDDDGDIPRPGVRQYAALPIRHKF